MDKHIIVKTDASVSPSKGVGLGYKAVVYNKDGTHEEYQGSQYLSQKIKTTKAEFIASIFAVKELYNEINPECEDYRLIVETDCEKTVKLYNHEPSKNLLQRTFDILSEKFESTSVRWISRSNNTTADAIARSKLQNGWEENKT